MLLSATLRILAVKSTMFAKISPKLKSMYLTMICLLEDSRVRTILDKENIFQDPDRESSGTGHIGLSRCLRVRADILP